MQADSTPLNSTAQCCTIPLQVKPTCQVIAILAAGSKLPFQVVAVKLDLPELQVRWQPFHPTPHAALPILPNPNPFDSSG